MMMTTALTITALLAQSPGEAPPAVPKEASPEIQQAALLERTAAAAERTAEAVTRLAESLAPKPSAAAAAAPAGPDGWVGSVGFGLTFLTGNSQQLTVTATGSADRNWDPWRIGLRVNGAYGLSNPSATVDTSTAAVTARRASGTIRGDRSFGGFASVFALAGSEFDHVKNVESRTVGELGSGLTFFDQKEGDLEKLYLRLDLAIRFGYETRFQYFPVLAPVKDYGIAILGPRAAATFRWSFNKGVRLTEEIEFIPFVLAPTTGRLLINNTTKLSARVTESVALTSAVVLSTDTKPPESIPKRAETDVAVTVGVEATF